LYICVPEQDPREGSTSALSAGRHGRIRGEEKTERNAAIGCDLLSQTLEERHAPTPRRDGRVHTAPDPDQLKWLAARGERVGPFDRRLDSQTATRGVASERVDHGWH